MPIKIVSEAGTFGPRVFCDECGRIVLGEEGTTVLVTTWREVTPEDPQLPVYLHKGDCDRAWESRNRSHGGWDDLDVHLLCLLNTVKYSYEELKQRLVRLNLF